MRVADPQLSPDGQSGGLRAHDDRSGVREAQRRHLDRRRPIRPAPAKPLIGGDKSENTPRWSPDGRRSRSSRRATAIRRCISPTLTAATSARSRTCPAACSRRSCSRPTATMVAFVADVYPDCSDDACNRQRREAADKDPVKVHVLTRLLYRHWDEWREGVRHHVFVAPIAGGPGARSDARRLRLAADAAGGRRASRSRPTAELLAFVSNRDGNDKEAWTTNNDVWLVPVTGGDGEEADRQSRGRRRSQSFTPDGKSHDRPRAAAAGLRVGSLVPRRLRPRDGREAHGVRDAGSVGQRLHALARRRRRSSSRRRATARTTCTACRLAGGAPQQVAQAARFPRRSAARARLVVFSKSHADVAGGGLPHRDRRMRTGTAPSRARTTSG